MSKSRPSKWIDVITLLVLFAPLVMLRVILLAELRIPMGHDTLQYLQLEYTFFNEAALHGSIPQWLPFMTQGTLSNFWVVISEGILPLTLTPFAALLKNVNFLYLFEAGLLFDQFILLLGCFLLARRYFHSLVTVIFVTSAITYTSITSTQIWWNFHLFYLIPLILFSFDRGIRETSSKYLFIAGILTASTLLGNLPYFAPVFAFALVIFGVSFVILAPKRISPIITNIIQRFSVRHFLALLIPTIFIGLIGVWYIQWQEAVVQYNLGRSANGATASIGQFLTYAGYSGFSKYVELISRFSNNIDNVIYGGLLVVPFVVVTILAVRSRISYAFGVTSLLLAALSAGTYVSVLFYYIFPLGNLFREIGILSPIVKMFLVFYAGFGFDYFVGVLKQKQSSKFSKLVIKDKIVLLFPVITVGIISVLIAITLIHIYPIFSFPPWDAPTSNQLFLTARQVSSALFSYLLLSISVFGILLITVFGGKRIKFFLVILLILSVVDVYSVNVQLEYGQVPQVNQSVLNLFNSYNYNYSSQRSQDYYANIRFTTLAPYILGGPQGGSVLPDRGARPYSTVGKWGVLYWNTESFVYMDSEASVFETDNILSSINTFYGIWVPPSEGYTQNVGFPIPNNTAYLSLSGYGEPKLQLFSALNVLPSENQTAQVLGSPADNGEMLFASISDLSSSQKNNAIVKQQNSSVIFTDERIYATEIHVEGFSFDNLKLLVNTGSNFSTVLYYADAWSPSWHAYVNGSEAPVIRANVGYKAVILPPGVSTVSFVYNDLSSEIIIDAIILLGIMAFLAVLYLFFNEVVRISVRVRR